MSVVRMLTDLDVYGYMSLWDADTYISIHIWSDTDADIVL